MSEVQPTLFDDVPQVVEYRDVPGYPGYRVGDDGSVWSCLKLVHPGGRQGNYSVISNEWHRLKSSRCGKIGNQFRYRAVALHKKGTPRIFLIHTLVLTTFVGPCPEGMECCHYNGDPNNNSLSNLSWGTRKDNGEDRVRHGTSNRGERHPLRKLTEAEVIAVRLDFANGLKQFEIARKYPHVTRGLIWAIVKRKIWKHLA